MSGLHVAQGGQAPVRPAPQDGSVLCSRTALPDQTRMLDPGGESPCFPASLPRQVHHYSTAHTMEMEMAHTAHTMEMAHQAFRPHFQSGKG